MLAPNKLRSVIFGNRGFTTPSAAGGATLVFQAAAANGSNVFTPFLTGVGDLTISHTSTLYAPESDGTYNTFTANKAVVYGGVYTDEDTVSDTGSTFLQFYRAGTNSQIYSNDLTNVEWTATTMTVAKDETGIDGSANGACTLTATGGNSTVIANAITAASDTHATAWYIKRKTGTGTVELTVDGGTTWQSVTLTSSFQRFAVDQATVTNPQIGIRIVTSGDAVIVGNAECHLVRQLDYISTLGPIFTTTAAVSTDRTVYSFTSKVDVGSDSTQVSLFADYVEIDMTGTASFGANIIGYNANQGLARGNGSTIVGKRLTDLVSTTAVSLLTASKIGNVTQYSPTISHQTIADGTWGAEDTTGTPGTGQLYVVGGGAASDKWSFRIRDYRRYDISDVQQGIDLLETLTA